MKIHQTLKVYKILFHLRLRQPFTKNCLELIITLTIIFLLFTNRLYRLNIPFLTIVSKGSILKPMNEPETPLRLSKLKGLLKILLYATLSRAYDCTLKLKNDNMT